MLAADCTLRDVWGLQHMRCNYPTPPRRAAVYPRARMLCWHAVLTLRMRLFLLQDVVTANPESWSFDPFKLTREGDKLLGRGVTDCLGHVALLAELFRQLAVHRPPLKATVMGVFIANEENSTVRERLTEICMLISMCTCRRQGKEGWKREWGGLLVLCDKLAAHRFRAARFCVEHWWRHVQHLTASPH